MFRNGHSPSSAHSSPPQRYLSQVHGMTDKAMRLYAAQAEGPLQIARGDLFGGQLPHIECLAKVRHRGASVSPGVTLRHSAAR